jgi:hypothetical protein
MASNPTEVGADAGAAEGVVRAASSKLISRPALAKLSPAVDPPLPRRFPGTTAPAPPPPPLATLEMAAVPWGQNTTWKDWSAAQSLYLSGLSEGKRKPSRQAVASSAPHVIGVQRSLGAVTGCGTTCTGTLKPRFPWASVRQASKLEQYNALGYGHIVVVGEHGALAEDAYLGRNDAHVVAASARRVEAQRDDCTQEGASEATLTIQINRKRLSVPVASALSPWR